MNCPYCGELGHMILCRCGELLKMRQECWCGVSGPWATGENDEELIRNAKALYEVFNKQYYFVQTLRKP